MELSLKEVEVQKLNLRPGDSLVVTVRSENVDEFDVQMLAEGFRKRFPGNQIIVLTVGTQDSIGLSVVKAPLIGCASPTSYCNDCNCGKREQIEGAK